MTIETLNAAYALVKKQEKIISFASTMRENIKYVAQSPNVKDLPISELASILVGLVDAWEAQEHKAITDEFTSI